MNRKERKALASKFRTAKSKGHRMANENGNDNDNWMPKAAEAGWWHPDDVGAALTDVNTRLNEASQKLMSSAVSISKLQRTIKALRAAQPSPEPQKSEEEEPPTTEPEIIPPGDQKPE